MTAPKPEAQPDLPVVVIPLDRAALIEIDGVQFQLNRFELTVDASASSALMATVKVELVGYQDLRTARVTAGLTDEEIGAAVRRYARAHGPISGVAS